MASKGPLARTLQPSRVVADCADELAGFLGAPAELPRLEAELAFEVLRQRFPRLDLASADIRWRPMINLRGLQALPDCEFMAGYLKKNAATYPEVMGDETRRMLGL